ncbi:DUF4087 domain-containing protein [Burkholderia sp. AU30280]|nr:DUF4087 domain-containing protein [Burkholderia sp. AU30280]
MVAESRPVARTVDCACLDLEIDPRPREVTRIVAARPLPLKRCNADRALRAP